MAGSGKLTESSIQSAVWHVELGRGKTVVYWVLLVLLALSLSLVYTASQFRGLDKREAMDQAQLARNLATGKGFTTDVIRPLSLWQLKTFRADHKALVENHPDLINPPLYPALLAGLFRLFPATIFNAEVNDRIYVPERWIILPFDQICLLLSVLLVYLWAKQLFDQRVAITAGLLLLFSDTLWQYGVSGLLTNLLLLLLLLALYCLYRIDRRLNAAAGDGEATAPARAVDGAAMGLLVLSAILLGLCFLTRYMTAFLLVPILFYLARILRGRAPARWIVIYSVVYVAVIAPWLVRNYRVSGSTLGIAKYAVIETGGPFNGDALQRTYHPEKENRLHDAWTLAPIGSKLMRGLRTQVFDSFARLGSVFLLPFFIVGVMYGFRRQEVARLRNVLLGLLALAVLAMAFVGVQKEVVGPDVNGDDLLVLLYPLVVVFGVAFFYLLLDRIPFRIRLTRGAAIGVFAFLNVWPMVFTLLPPTRKGFSYPPYSPPVARAVSVMFHENAFGCSDMPWETAWYGDRRTVWLPTTIDDFTDMNDFLLPNPGFSFLFITPYMLDQPLNQALLHGEYEGWAMLIHGRLPDRFPLRAFLQLPPYGEQYLLADRARWKEGPFGKLFGGAREETATETNAPPPAAAGNATKP